LPLVPLRKNAFRREIGTAIDWYNEHRPHTTLGGRTPNEVYAGRYPSNEALGMKRRACSILSF